VWLHKLKTTNLKHQTQTRFCHFLLFLCLVGEEFCSCQLVKWGRKMLVNLVLKTSAWKRYTIINFRNISLIQNKLCEFWCLVILVVFYEYLLFYLFSLLCTSHSFQHKSALHFFLFCFVFLLYLINSFLLPFLPFLFS